MSTIFNIRSLKLPGVSQTALVVSTVVVVLAIVSGLSGWNVYTRLTTNSVVAYFPETLALYPDDRVQIMGVKVGAIELKDRDSEAATEHLDRALACRSVALAMVGTVLDSVWVVARYRQRADSGRTGTPAGHMTIYAQMPDTLALNVLINHVGPGGCRRRWLWHGSLRFSFALQSAEALRPDHRNDRSSCTGTIHG